MVAAADKGLHLIDQVYTARGLQGPDPGMLQFLHACATASLPTRGRSLQAKSYKATAMPGQSDIRPRSLWSDSENLVVGCAAGRVHVFNGVRDSDLRPRFQLQVSKSAVTCLTPVPATRGRPSAILASTLEALVVLDCALFEGEIEDLALRQRLRVAPTGQPLQSTFSPSGFFVSGSADGLCYVYSRKTYRRETLKHRGDALPSCAVNATDTVLATGDVAGRIVLWRRVGETQ